MTPYAGNSAVYPTTISLIDDSDAPDASNFDAAPQALADRTAFLKANSLFTTGGTVTGTIEFVSGAILQIDTGAEILLNGIENVNGSIQVLSGGSILVASGATLTINPGAVETIYGSLIFQTGSRLQGAISTGILNFTGNSISLDAAGGLVANAVNAIQIVSPQGLEVLSGGSIAWASGSVENFLSGSSLEIQPGAVASVSGLIDVLVNAGIKVESGASIELEAGGTLLAASGSTIALGVGSQLGFSAGVPVRRNTGAATPPTMNAGDVTEFALTTTTTTSGGVNTARFAFTVTIGAGMMVDMMVSYRNPDSGGNVMNPIRILAGGVNSAGSMLNVYAFIESNPVGFPLTISTTTFLGTFTVVIVNTYSGASPIVWTAVCRATVS